MEKRTIGILTGGGDCPGLNAVIRAVTKASILDYGWKVMGILDGYDGLVTGRVRPLHYNDVGGILPLGGTILGTSNKADPFNFAENGGKTFDASDRAIENLEKWGVTALICVGGDGTLSIADRFRKKWPNVIGIPKTIDNDLEATDQTFGFDTACNFVTEAIDRIHSTALSHHRAMIVEVMGRYAGWIALEGGMAGGGDIILIPEIPFSFDKVYEAIESRVKKGKRASIVVVAEGARPIGEDYTVGQVVKDSPDPIRLGGIGKRVANAIEKNTGHESRVTVLGHLQRGGSPSFLDRILATSYGMEAVRQIEKNNFGKMIALRNAKITTVDIEEAISKLRLVPKDNKLLQSAASLDTSFGV